MLYLLFSKSNVNATSSVCGTAAREPDLAAKAGGMRGTVPRARLAEIASKVNDKGGSLVLKAIDKHDRSTANLFDMPVQVRATVRKDGAVVPAHTRVVKVKAKEQAKPRQHVSETDLFGDDPVMMEKPKETGAKVEPQKPEAKPSFNPTHELSDGTKVIAHPDEKGVWVDENGDEHEATDDVLPISDVPTKEVKHADVKEPVREDHKADPIRADSVAVEKRDVATEQDDEPKEGDTKTEEGVEYVLRGGRWHRASPEEKPHDPVAFVEDKEDLADAMANDPHSERSHELAVKVAEGVKGDRLGKLREWIEKQGGKSVAAEMFKKARKDTKTRMQAERVIDELSRSTGLSRDEILSEFGIKEVEREHKQTERKETHSLDVGGTFEDDDPNSPNYRFRDTGYIGGSRKELAAESIKKSGRDGTQMRATSIDWVEIEKNPRQAKELITKSNLFGRVDWESLKASGMEPGAGFLIDRVYASIAPEPSQDNPQARHDYAIGLESLRDRLEKCKTPNDVTKQLEEIKEEYEGVSLNAEETEKYNAVQGIINKLHGAKVEYEKENDRLFYAYNGILGKIESLKWDQEKRTKRGWKRDTEIDRKIAELQPSLDAAHKEWSDWREKHPEMQESWVSGKDDHGNYFGRTSGPVTDALDHAFKMRKAVVDGAKERNAIENPVHRAWNVLGDRFAAVINYRRYKGSDAFQKHVTAAKTGKIKDWSWSEKERSAVPKVREGAVRFQLKVADKFERTGGSKVQTESTAALKEMFGLRDVQSGNWVLKDPESAAFHVQRSAEAFSDLADLIGVPANVVSMNGRLALAFGARGHGAAGWADSAPRAHYESVHRVINLTKMGGGGSLGHEWFHAMDNMLKEMETKSDGKKDEYVTENPSLLPSGELHDVISDLHRALNTGEHRLSEKIRYTDKDYRTAKYNIDTNHPNQIARAIKAAGDVHAAVRAVDAAFHGREDRKSESRRKQWRTLATAYYDGKEAGGEVKVQSGRAVSSFAYEAYLLDGGQDGKYWSKTLEMAARAFQAWCEDTLQSKGRRNDYLSAMADNKYYKDPLFGDQKPFPEGDERKRLNAVFDRLAKVLSEQNILQKAMERIFGGMIAA